LLFVKTLITFYVKQNKTKENTHLK